ncbi:hypothetical protein Tco_0628302 [Tanacetum coccineum]|uniref:Uncharacterized protein n=1 Tax=Tanacetum coccineum TaxID=301880 RepID=A0ABQ4WPY5_9ASTR
MVAFLEKSTGSAGFHQVINFLNRSHICYALTKKPDVYISFIKQFGGLLKLLLMIMEKSRLLLPLMVTQRLSLKLLTKAYMLDDQLMVLLQFLTSEDYWSNCTHGIITQNLDNPKKTAWEQFSSNIATAVIYLATNRRFNFSSTAEENISTVGRTVTYRRRSEKKRTRKDKGKAIMTESEPKKKSKKEIEQKKEEWQRAMSEVKSSKKIDWNDASVIRNLQDRHTYVDREEIPSKSRDDNKDVE